MYRLPRCRRWTTSMYHTWKTRSDSCFRFAWNWKESRFDSFSLRLPKPLRKSLWNESERDEEMWFMLDQVVMVSLKKSICYVCYQRPLQYSAFRWKYAVKVKNSLESWHFLRSLSFVKSSSAIYKEKQVWELPYKLYVIQMPRDISISIRTSAEKGPRHFDLFDRVPFLGQVLFSRIIPFC